MICNEIIKVKEFVSNRHFSVDARLVDFARLSSSYLCLATADESDLTRIRIFLLLLQRFIDLRSNHQMLVKVYVISIYETPIQGKNSIMWWIKDECTVIIKSQRPATSMVLSKLIFNLKKI